MCVCLFMYMYVCVTVVVVAMEFVEMIRLVCSMKIGLIIANKI